jgi:hypothetical protein
MPRRRQHKSKTGKPDMTESTGYLIGRLEALLAEDFSAAGGGLEAKLRSVGGELPDDLRESLRQLAQESGGLDQDGAVQFAFRCGQAHERLETLAQSRLAANIAFLGPDGTPPPDLEKNDLDAIARFVKLRDRLLKTVADYTLKFLLVSAVLLVLGLSLGLI